MLGPPLNSSRPGSGKASAAAGAAKVPELPRCPKGLVNTWEAKKWIMGRSGRCVQTEVPLR